MEHLDRARDDIRKASERAPGPVHTQLNSIMRGIAEEEGEGKTETTGGETTQDEPGPKIDRVAEVAQKLDGLEDEIEDDETRTHVVDARHHLESYMRNHPQGG